MPRVQIKGLGRREVTPWISAAQRPAVPGLYQRLVRNSGIVTWARWNGRFWCTFGPRNYAARSVKKSINQCHLGGMPWRGLAAPYVCGKPGRKAKP